MKEDVARLMHRAHDCLEDDEVTQDDALKSIQYASDFIHQVETYLLTLPLVNDV